MSLQLGVDPRDVRGLRVTEYDALVGQGLLTDEAVELLEGVLVRVRPRSAPHAEATRRLVRQLAPQVPRGWVLSIQAPLRAGDLSQPEPDVAVVPDLDYSHGIPRTPSWSSRFPCPASRWTSESRPWRMRRQGSRSTGC